MKGLTLALALATFLFWKPVIVEAQGLAPCGPYDIVSEKLAAEHQEVVDSRGLTANGWLMEIFATVDHASWTAVLVQPDKTTCLMAAGTMWDKDPIIAKPRGPSF